MAHAISLFSHYEIYIAKAFKMWTSKSGPIGGDYNWIDLKKNDIQPLKDKSRFLVESVCI